MNVALAAHINTYARRLVGGAARWCICFVLLISFTAFTNAAICPAGSYISGNTCTKCLAGTYNDVNNASPCKQCPAGTYGNVQGLTSISCSGKCDKGHYCEAGSTSPTQKKCPAGTYGATTGLSTSVCSGLCTAGFYCVEGSTTATAAPCDAGRFGMSGATTKLCSGACAAGHYCPTGVVVVAGFKI
jgi:hypothetical protein